MEYDSVSVLSFGASQESMMRLVRGEQMWRKYHDSQQRPIKTMLLALVFSLGFVNDEL